MTADRLASLLPAPKAGDPGAFLCAAERAWCTWNGLHGGALMGMLIAGMEQLAGKPAVAVTAQYIKGVKEGDGLALRAEVLAASSAVAQVRISALRGEDLVATAFGSFGAGGAAVPAARAFPRVRSPDDSPARTFLRAPLEGDVAETLEIRIAEAAPTGAALWIRCPFAAGRPMSASLLAAIADHPPYGVRLALGGEWYGISLDAGLRVAAPIAELDAGRWVLVEIVFDAMVSPFAFATAYLWTSEGGLLAVSPQSMRIRNGAR